MLISEASFELIDDMASQMTFLGGNSRCKGNRMRKLGWNPVKNTKDMFDAIQDEVAALLGSS